MLRQARENGGFLINGRGRPICLINRKKKDIVNTVCQGLGHDCLKRILWHQQVYRKQYKVDLIPYRPDFHDERLDLIRPTDREIYIDMVNYSFEQLNLELGWDVKIKHGGISFGKDMSVRCG